MGTVTGKVTCKGIPVTVGMVEIDLPGAGVGAYSLLDEEGRFAIEEFPIRTGVYTVCVRPPSHPDPEHPVFKRKSAVKIPRYAQSMATSGLTITVNPGKNDVVIELKD